MSTVSVIIPCFNHGHYLTDAVSSVLAQVYTDWEAIIVDDGSTDDTREVAAQFTDPRVRYIFQENRGLSGARNTGIRLAEGSIIALLDADDYWHADYLERMVPFLVDSPGAAAVYCGAHLVDDSGTLILSPEAKVVPPDCFYRTLICEGNWLVVHGVLFWRELAEQAGLFDETLQAVEDADLWKRLASKHPFVGLPEALVYYRRHGANMSSDPHRMVSASYQSTVKSFGLPEGNPALWPSLKRCAFARVYRLGVRLHLAKGETSESADYLRQLASVSPQNAQSATFWENLAFVRIETEDRAVPSRLGLIRAEHSILHLLHEVSEKHSDALDEKARRGIERAALLSLASLASKTRDLRSCSRLLWNAIRRFPETTLSRSFWSTVGRALGLHRTRPRAKVLHDQ